MRWLPIVLLVQCGAVQRGPFLPGHVVICTWDGDCRRNETCRFVYQDAPAICVPGENELDAKR